MLRNVSKNKMCILASWNAMVQELSQQGHAELVLHCSEWMRCEGLSPNRFMYICILKACGSIKAQIQGYGIHSEIAEQGFLQNDTVLATAVLDMYVKCGSLVNAEQTFYAIQDKNVVSWTALIGGYTQHGECEKALKAFEQMKKDGIEPNTITFICVLKACGILHAIEIGEEIYVEVVKRGLLAQNRVVGNAILDMYVKCGLFEKSQEVFDEILIPDVVAWTTLIAGYVQHGHGEKALYTFRQMQQNGSSPNVVTFSCIVKACGIIQAADKGQEVHAILVRSRYLEKNNVAINALVDMYAKCGLLKEAQDIFDDHKDPDVVSWTILITGYVQHGFDNEGLNCFERMQANGLSPSAITFASVLRACGATGAVEKGKDVHALIIREGLLENDTVLRNALIYMYAKTGLLGNVEELFDKFVIRDDVSWNTVILGYAQHGSGEKALKYFAQMQCEGFCPDTVTFSAILKVCGIMGDTKRGHQLHARILRDECLAKEIMIANALMDMYTKCGRITKAQLVFDELPAKDIASWNTLIAGYAQTGNDDFVFLLFEEMITQGKQPDFVTFTHVLNTCNHSGELDKGQVYFHIMITSYGLIPTLEQYTCTVDLFARVGHLDYAVGIIEKMPFVASLSAWHSLLSACQKWGNVELGICAFEHTVQLDENDASAYVCMSNIFATSSIHKDS